MSSIIFFPSITFSLIGAEIFPWAFLYAISKMRSINYRLLVITFFIFSSFIFVTFSFQGSLFGESVRSAAAYLNPLFMFFVLLKVSDSEIIRLYGILRKILVFLFVLGILQFLSALSFFEFIIQFLVPRASGDVLSDVRGVTLLSSEPSRASIEYVFMYATWRAVTKISAEKRVWIDILVVSFIVLIIRSAIGAAVIFLIMAMYYRLKVILPAIVFAALFAEYFSSVRAVSVFSTLMRQGTAVDSFTYLLNQSGFRLISVMSSYYDALGNFWGNGVGNWRDSSVAAMSALGYEPADISYFRFRSDGEFYGVRPTSFYASIALELGIFGLLLVSYFVGSLCFGLVRRAGTVVLPIFFAFGFSMYFIGSIGNPVPWICLVLAARMVVIERANSHSNKVLV